MRILEVATQSGDWYDETRPEESMRFIKECGFEGIDYNINNVFNDTFDRENLTSFFNQSDEEIFEYYKPMKEAAKKYDVSISQAHALFPAYRRDRQERNSYLLKVIEKQMMVCQYLDCKSIVVHPWYDAESTKEEEREINLHIYRSLMPAAKKYGVKICLENTFLSKNHRITEACCANAEEVCWYIDTLNEEAGEDIFGFCLDIGHANVLGKNLYHYITALGKRLTVLHIHDNNGTSDSHMIPFSQRDKTGYRSTIDWSKFIRGLKEIGYEGPLAFETFLGIAALPEACRPEGLKLVSSIGRHFRQEIMENK